MARIVRKSVAPIYLVGGVWLVYAILFPLYRLSDYLICAVVSIAFFILGKSIWPDAAIITDEEEPPTARKTQEPAPKPKEEKKSTGDPQLDRLLEDRERAVSEMHRLNEAIQDEKISAQIDHLEDATKKIIDQVVAQPGKLPRIRRFMDYYLPTTLKILNAYDRMGATGLSGGNVGTTMGKVEEMMDVLVSAFDKQLDDLFGEEALDISTDIAVLEQMLAREGLGGLDLNSEGK